MAWFDKELTKTPKEIEEIAATITDAEVARRLHRYRCENVVFVPEPDKKWTKQLIGCIPKEGHELDCPVEFNMFPYAKYEWLRIMRLNRKINTLTAEHRELIYGYCLMVERRKRCLLEWGGDIMNGGRSKKDIGIKYLAAEIMRLTEEINKLGSRLGLFPKKEKEKRTIKERNEAARLEYEEEYNDGEVEEDVEERVKKEDNADLFD